MVSNASEDLPEPDRPVITVRLSRGISTSTFLRLCARAPRTWMKPAIEVIPVRRRCSCDVLSIWRIAAALGRLWHKALAQGSGTRLWHKALAQAGQPAKAGKPPRWHMGARDPSVSGQTASRPG